MEHADAAVIGAEPPGCFTARALAGNGAVPDWLRPCGNCAYIHDLAERAAGEAAPLEAALGGELDFEGHI